MRYSILTAAVLTALAFSFGGSANAQRVSDDVMSRCSKAVGQMKFEGWPADRNREMAMLACQSSGGHMPGTQEERPAALPHRAPVQQR